MKLLIMYLGEDCVTLQSVDPDPENGIHVGGWNDDHCQSKYSFICELFLGDSPWNLNKIDYPTTGGCKKGWLPFGGNCFNFGNITPGNAPGNNDLKQGSGDLLGKLICLVVKDSKKVVWNSIVEVFLFRF